MRRKRSRKKLMKLNGKLLTSLFICLMLILTSVEPRKTIEVAAVSSFSQPINIMYSLLAMRHFDQQIGELNGGPSFENYIRSVYKIKNDKLNAQNQQPQGEKETNVQEEQEQQATLPNNENTNQGINESTKQENTQVKQQNEQKMVYLTFDDGPSAYTMQILDALQSYDMKATFFMLEPNMRTYENELQATIENGHIPALHGVTHRIDLIYRSEKTVVDEMTAAQGTLMQLTGTVSHLIRTPYGSAPYMKPSYKQAVEEAGFQLWDWTIDSEDWKYKNGEYVPKVIQQIENYRLHESPMVILLHDKKSTAEHLPQLLTYLKNNGYQAELLDEKLTAFHF
ncbi:polysaccharide deacetylase [Cytobacillus depressus]|uniref:Polysaccharide deacetylase n=1 Tax=Cytobacillus depressus TaxID=1602942 RepID=A0A6L3VBH0_9BACI|nr:polysaccharide deacetylase family protein [Cytobacillus depressus]KAB2338113.1 polysaccharide deacetylase [Cytobacillus depressus]